MRICSIDRCDKQARSNAAEWCDKHYHRWYRHGDPHHTEIDMRSYSECLHCNIKIPTKKRGGKFCSGRCRARYSRGCSNLAECANCGAQFVPIKGKVTCSDDCAAEHKRTMFREWCRRKYYECEDFRRKHIDYRLDRQRKKAGAQFTDHEVFLHNEWLCQICGEVVDSNLTYPDPQSATIDHILPMSLGGLHIRENVQLAHLVCNQRKNDLRHNRKTAMEKVA